MNGDIGLALLLFAGSAALVVSSGIYLAKYGDALAGLTGWGRLWVGTILLAAATSLPELATNITAVIRDQPALAMGNALGSNMVNMLTLAMVALVFGGAIFFRQVSYEHKYLALMAIFLTGLALTLGVFNLGISYEKVGLSSLLILTLYLAGIRLVYIRRPQHAATGAATSSGGHPGVRKAWLFFGLASLGVLVAAPTLAFSTELIAEETGLATSFLGVVAVALVTNLPEASTAIAAIRIGAVDLGVGNLYGSCAFNILVIALADPFYRKGTLVETLENPHAAAGLAAIFLMGIGLTQILLRGGTRFLPVVPTMLAMGLVYAGGIYAVYALG